MSRRRLAALVIRSRRKSSGPQVQFISWEAKAIFSLLLDAPLTAVGLEPVWVQKIAYLRRRVLERMEIEGVPSCPKCGRVPSTRAKSPHHVFSYLTGLHDADVEAVPEIQLVGLKY